MAPYKMSGSDQPGSGGGKPAPDSYYAKGSAELATESALTLLKIQHVSSFHVASLCAP